jgi:DNA-binding MarR family transcriptional regulator
MRTIGGVATHLRVTHAPASRAVAALSRKAYVSTRIDADDRRMRRIDLTASGRALLDRDPANRLAAAIGALSPVDQMGFATALAMVSRRLGQY